MKGGISSFLFFYYGTKGVDAGVVDVDMGGCEWGREVERYKSDS